MAQGSQYADSDRQAAAIRYAHCGQMSLVSRELNIPRSTLRSWRESPEWDETIADIRQQKSEEHIAAYSALTDKALAAASHGIDQLGDRELTPNDIKALTVTAAAATDKARLIAGLATSRSESTANIAQLAETFKQLSQQHAAPAIEHDPKKPQTEE